ncbi:MAG: transketolase C-terminal domain-containing protein [Candidatus Paceibacterota bacterium]|jgi:transketolase
MKILTDKIFDLNIIQKAIRDGFGEGIVLAAEENEKIVTLSADLADSTRLGSFIEKFPKRFFQIGVAEQNLATIAAGMAAMDKIPFITSFAIFSPGRNWEIIRTAICLNETNVKIVGSHAGLSVGADGASHQALEDIALMRVLPNMTVVVPADAEEAQKATIAIADLKGPVYLRLSREKTPVITISETPFEIGRALVVRETERPQVTIIACGLMVYRALIAAKKLSVEGVECTVINNHTIKPLDKKNLLIAIEKAGAVVVAEEHQKIAGLGGAIAELLAENYPVPLEFVGVDNLFGQSGNATELLELYGLGIDDIVVAVRKVLKRKNAQK